MSFFLRGTFCYFIEPKVPVQLVPLVPQERTSVNKFTGGYYSPLKLVRWK